MKKWLKRDANLVTIIIDIVASLAAEQEKRGQMSAHRRSERGGRDFSRAALAVIGATVLALVLVGCAKVTVRKVPSPSQYVEWTDRMQEKADEMEGFRFYLPRPFINVFESFPVRTDVFLAEGVVSADGRFVVVRRMWDENGNTRYPGGFKEGLRIDSKFISRGTDTKAQSDEEEDAEPATDLPGVAPGLPGRERTPPVAGATQPPTTGQNRRAVTNDNSAYAYQPMRGNLDVVYLPDFDEQYVVSSSSGLGNVEFQLNFGQGWSLQGFNSLADNSQLNNRIFDVIDSATQLAETAAFAAAGLPSLPTQLPGMDAIAPQAGEEDPVLVQGTPVSLKVVIVHYAAKGAYPVIKPRELQERIQTESEYFIWIDIFRWGGRTTPATKFDPDAIKRARQSISNETGKFTVPRYPYQYIAFNTFRYMAIETLTPGAHPFGTLYDKTGTQGDPGDRRLESPPPATAGLSSVIPPADRGKQADLQDFADSIQNLNTPKINGVVYTVTDAKVVDDKVSVTLREDKTSPPQSVKVAQIKEALRELGSQPPAPNDQIEIENMDDLKTVEKPQVTEEQGSELSPEELRSATSASLSTDVNREEIRQIQAALCLRGKNIDGVWGQQTRQMLIRYQKEKDHTPNGQLTPDLKTELLSLSGGEIGTRCSGSMMLLPVESAGPSEVVQSFADSLLDTSFDMSGTKITVTSSNPSTKGIDVTLLVEGQPNSTIPLENVKGVLLKAEGGAESGLTLDDITIGNREEVSAALTIE
ncbi:MAG: hypothetical protein MI892_10920 [Desulfobacterales bacterium]|nr:hypothetical protein [Desulfobacterales bacterium]